MGPTNLRLLNQSTHPSAANSTSSRFRKVPLGQVTSVLKRPKIVSAISLSYEAPKLPTEGSIPASAKRFV